MPLCSQGKEVRKFSLHPCVHRSFNRSKLVKLVSKARKKQGLTSHLYAEVSIQVAAGSYIHFKMESMKHVMDYLPEEDFMVKIDLEDAYCHIPIHYLSWKYLRFQWRQKLYEMLVLAFGVDLSPRIFTKLVKVPLTILRRLMFIIIAYLDDLLLIERTRKEASQAMDSVIFLLTQLSFTVNWKKSVLKPTQVIAFLA